MSSTWRALAADLGGQSGFFLRETHRLRRGWGQSAPPQLMGSLEGRDRLDLRHRVLRKTSQWVGWLEGALLVFNLGIERRNPGGLHRPEDLHNLSL